MDYPIFDCSFGREMDKSIFTVHYAQLLKQLRAARQQAGLTQEELARRIGQTQSFVSKCERGERRLDLVELRVFCRAMSIPLERFIADLEKELPDD